MNHPLFERLVTLGYPRLDADNFESRVQAQAFSVLFLSEDPNRFPESLDVAVILPELVKAFPQLSPALIDRSFERTLQERYGFSVWPALVFLKEGRYLGTLSRILNWQEYLEQIPQILAREPQDQLIPLRALDSSNARSCAQPTEAS